MNSVQEQVEKFIPRHRPLSKLDDIISWRKQALIDYQNADYAKIYTDFVARVKAFDRELFANTDYALTKAVAKSLFKLMAYKDEYEVARLFADGKFKQQIEQVFEGDYSLNFHLAAPLLSRKHKETGHLVKRRYPGFTMHIFKMLAKLKFLRGSVWDVFAYTDERRKERQLPKDYMKLIESLIQSAKPESYETLVDIAELAQKIRGYGHVKEKSIEHYEQRLPELISSYEKTLVREPEKILAYEVA